MAAVSSTPTIDEIVALMHARRGGMGRMLQAMREVRDTYNAEMAVPLPEMSDGERNATANLLRQGLDGNAQRISSTMPDVYFPAGRATKKAQVEARQRRQAVLGWWEMTDMNLVLARRARHLVGYGCSPIVIRPDTKRGICRWDVQDPMAAYPAPPAYLDDMLPTDCVFTFMRSWKWLRSNYGPQVSTLTGSRGCGDDETFECVEYFDDQVHVLGVIGRQSQRGSPVTGRQAGAWRDTRGGRDGLQRNIVVGGDGGGGYSCVELERNANPLGRCPVVVPGRVTLERVQGQLDGMIGKYITQARLQALELIAIEEGIWPKTWLVARQNEVPKVIRLANGRRGQMGLVTGGEIQVIQQNPGYKTGEAIDRLAEAQRQEGSVPASFTGQVPTNVRTGRQSDFVLSAQIDFNIQESQLVLAKSVQHEDEIAIAGNKAWFGGAKKSFYVDWRGAKGPVTYEPNELFPAGADQHRVRYAMAGADLNAQVVRVGQKVGLELASRQWGREMDPEIEDPEGEHDRVTFEALEKSILVELAQPGSMSVVDKARIMQSVVSDRLELAESIIEVHEEAQRKQATEGPPGTETGPVPPGSPEAQPGIAPPGMGEEAGTIPAPGPSLDHLSQLLGGLGRTRSALRAAS